MRQQLPLGPSGLCACVHHVDELAPTDCDEGVAFRLACAGQDLEATAKARSWFPDVPPSSPSIFLVKDQELVAFVPRHRIENRDAASIAFDLVEAFDAHCAA